MSDGLLKRYEEMNAEQQLAYKMGYDAAAGRFLALTETGPDYEAAHEKALEWGVQIIPPATKAIVDAALADYLTEEET